MAARGAAAAQDRLEHRRNKIILEVCERGLQLYDWHVQTFGTRGIEEHYEPRDSAQGRKSGMAFVAAFKLLACLAQVVEEEAQSLIHCVQVGLRDDLRKGALGPM
jgi:hypothetical protein